MPWPLWTPRRLGVESPTKHESSHRRGDVSQHIHTSVPHPLTAYLLRQPVTLCPFVFFRSLRSDTFNTTPHPFTQPSKKGIADHVPKRIGRSSPRNGDGGAAQAYRCCPVLRATPTRAAAPEAPPALGMISKHVLMSNVVSRQGHHQRAPLWLHIPESSCRREIHSVIHCH